MGPKGAKLGKVWTGFVPVEQIPIERLELR